MLAYIAACRAYLRVHDFHASLFALALAIALLGACATTSAPAPAPAAEARHRRGAAARDRARARTSRPRRPNEELDSLATWPGRGRPDLAHRHRQVDAPPVVFDAERRHAPAHLRQRRQRRPASSTAPTASPCMAITCSWSNATTTACRCSQLPDFNVARHASARRSCAAPTACGSTRPNRASSRSTSPTASCTARSSTKCRRARNSTSACAATACSSTRPAACARTTAARSATRSEASALRMVESIAGDRANDRLLDRRRGPSPRIDAARVHLQRQVHRPQPAAGQLRRRSRRRGAVDVPGRRRLLDRGRPARAADAVPPVRPRDAGTARHASRATSPRTPTASPCMPRRCRDFPGGALFAVHDDKAVTAFDLRDVADALHLRRTAWTDHARGGARAGWPSLRVLAGLALAATRRGQGLSLGRQERHRPLRRPSARRRGAARPQVEGHPRPRRARRDGAPARRDATAAATWPSPTTPVAGRSRSCCRLRQARPTSRGEPDLPARATVPARASALCRGCSSVGMPAPRSSV